MTVRIELPRLPDTALTSFDPRWKLVALLAAAAVAAAVRAPGPVAAAFAIAVALLAAARVPLPWYADRVLVLAPLLAALLVLLPFTVGGEGPAWQIGPLRVSLYGFWVALRLALKSVTVLTLMLVLLATTPIPRLLHAAQAVRVPAFLVHLTALTFRYLFLLLEELGRLRVALRVRGYRNRADLHSYRTIGHVTGVLLVRSAERAERVGQAMRCRGFAGRFRSLAEFRTRRGDVRLFLLVICLNVGLVVWELGVQ